MFRRAEGWVLLELGLLKAVLGSFTPLPPCRGQPEAGAQL